MVHLLLYGVVAVVLGGALFALAARFLPAGEQIAPPVRDEPPWDLPADRSMRPEDVDSVRLPVALRGYRFAETDLLLDRLSGELAARDQEIARLRVALGEVPAEPVEDEPAAAEPAAAEPAAAEPAAAVPDADIVAGEQLDEALAVDEALDESAAPAERTETAGKADADLGAVSLHGPGAPYPPPSSLNSRYEPSAPPDEQAARWATSAPPWAVAPAPAAAHTAAQASDDDAEPEEPAPTARRRRRRRT